MAAEFMIISIILIYAVNSIFGIIGNALIIAGFGFKSDFNKNPVFIAFICNAATHIGLLVIGCFDITEIAAIIDITERSLISCGVYHLIYRGLLFSQSGYDIKFISISN